MIRINRRTEQTSGKNQYKLIGKGLYTVPEVSRLLGLNSQRVRNWVKGYKYKSHGADQFVSPLFPPDIGDLNKQSTISFSDLIELRFVKEFLGHGISLRSIRIASRRAQELLNRSHPFSTNIFKTDGRTILAEIAKREADRDLLDLVRHQYEITEIFDPFLYKAIEFSDDDHAIRWWPVQDKKSIVIDPARCFGQPIITNEGVPTQILWRSYRVEENYRAVAHWYDVEEQSVRDAVEFEDRLAA